MHDKICGVNLQLTSGISTVFFSVYLPAVGSDDDFPSCLDELSVVIDALSGESFVIVCGDFNADNGKCGGSRRSKAPTKRGLILMDLIKRHDFVPQIFWMTHQALCILTRDRRAVLLWITYLSLNQLWLWFDCVTSCRMECEHLLNTSDLFPVLIKCNLVGLSKNSHSDPACGKVIWDKLTVTRTLGDKIFIMELARGSFQDENSVPSCKKYHSLAHASKNLYSHITGDKQEMPGCLLWCG